MTKPFWKPGTGGQMGSADDAGVLILALVARQHDTPSSKRAHTNSCIYGYTSPSKFLFPLLGYVQFGVLCSTRGKGAELAVGDTSPLQFFSLPSRRLRFLPKIVA